MSKKTKLKKRQQKPGATDLLIRDRGLTPQELELIYLELVPEAIALSAFKFSITIDGTGEILPPHLQALKEKGWGNEMINLKWNADTRQWLEDFVSNLIARTPSLEGERDVILLRLARAISLPTLKMGERYWRVIEDTEYEIPPTLDEFWEASHE